MAAPVLFQRCRRLAHLLDVGWRYTSTSAGSSPLPLKRRILHYLNSKYYDMENLINWSIRLKHWNLRRKNAYFAYAVNVYGHYVAAAYFVLCQRGGIRFQGQEEWYRPNKWGRFSWEFVNHKDLPVEAVDFSGSLVNYNGLENIVSLKELKYLNLSNCPHVDDWCLSRLHEFRDTLEELSLAGCPHVTERGLASLHHLENLKHLDVSDLPSVTNKGLVGILLEEILPQCYIVGMDCKSSLGLDSPGAVTELPQAEQRMGEKDHTGKATDDATDGATDEQFSAPSSPGNPGVPGDSSSQAEGAAASAPPDTWMNHLPAYEETTVGENETNGVQWKSIGNHLSPFSPTEVNGSQSVENGVNLLPPPPYPGTGPENNHFVQAIEWSTPVISEEAAKQALLEYAEKKCCYRTSPAVNMVLENLQAFSIYRYRLESFTESRTLKQKHVPYRGGKVDSSRSGAAPLLWEMQVDIPAMFQKGKEKHVVPHTEHVEECHMCMGSGRTRCICCGGSGRTTCFSCGGLGRQYNGNLCWSCSGSGRRMCTACSSGWVTCATCAGNRRLLFYTQVKVIWDNCVSDFVTDQSSELPTDRFQKVTGRKIFTDEQTLVQPVMSFPDPMVNQVSMSYIQQHCNHFESNPRIRQQRHSIELMPLIKVSYTWKEKPHTYFVYGLENKVYTDNYPAKCCCSVM